MTRLVYLESLEEVLEIILRREKTGRFIFHDRKCFVGIYSAKNGASKVKVSVEVFPTAEECLSWLVSRHKSYLQFISPKGKIFDTIEDAVKAFMCPGPCSPDCPLNEAKKLPNGMFCHQCAPAWYTLHEALTAEAMGYKVRLTGDDA